MSPRLKALKKHRAYLLKQRLKLADQIERCRAKGKSTTIADEWINILNRDIHLLDRDIQLLTKREDKS